MDIGFSNVNPVLHCPGTLLGVGVMENWGRIFGGNDKYSYSIYSHAYCESIAEVQYAFYQEEVALAEKMGVGIQKFSKKNFLSRTSILGPEYMGDDCIVPFDEQWRPALEPVRSVFRIGILQRIYRLDAIFTTSWERNTMCRHR